MLIFLFVDKPLLLKLYLWKQTVTNESSDVSGDYLVIHTNHRRVCPYGRPDRFSIHDHKEEVRVTTKNQYQITTSYVLSERLSVFSLITFFLG